MKQKIIKKIDNDAFRNSVEILSFRPFNMKGQELEELLFYLLSDDNWEIKMPQLKTEPDIIIKNGNITTELEVKFYTGANRMQFKTSLKTTLDIIRKLAIDFKKNKKIIKQNIIADFKKIDEDFILTFFTPDNFGHTYFLEREFLSKFMNESEISVSWHGKGSKYPRFNFENSRKENGKFTLVFEAGQNPLNRGFWFEDVKDIHSLTKIGFLKTGFSWKLKRVDFEGEEWEKFIKEKVESLIKI